MKRILKKNQLIIAALAVMIAAAGYLIILDSMTVCLFPNLLLTGAN